MNRITSSILVCVLMLVALSACGKVKPESAPPGATITINPSTFAFTDTSATAASHTKSFTITVLDEEGLPLNNALINIHFAFTALTAIPAGTDPLNQLFLDGIGVSNLPFNVSTNSSGVYTLKLDFQSGGGLKYSGNLEVRSGTAFQSATITIN